MPNAASVRAAFADDDLGNETLDEGVAHATIDRGHEIQPVRRQAGSQVWDVDDTAAAKTARAPAYAAIISRYVVTSAPPIS